MTHLVKQWIARALALCVLGPIAARIGGGVIAADGSHQTTMLTGRSLFSGVIALLLVGAITLVTGVVCGRMIDRREGFLNMALVLGWVAWTSGRLGEVYRLAPEVSTLVRVALEALVLSVIVLIGLMLMTDPGGGAQGGRRDDVSRFDPAHVINSVRRIEGVYSMLAAMLGAIIVAYLFGQNDLAGQSVGVGFVAGVVGGTLGALVANMARKVDEKNDATAFAPIMLGIMLAGVLSPLIGIFKPGSGDLLELVLKGDLPGYLIVSPASWVMGAVLGVPVGHSWVEHSVHQQTQAPGQPRHA